MCARLKRSCLRACPCLPIDVAARLTDSTAEQLAARGATGLSAVAAARRPSHQKEAGSSKPVTVCESKRLAEEDTVMNDERRIVKQLDHLLVRVADPEPLFKLLSETLKLPVAWPLRAYPAFTSGGVTLGNLYLEILSCSVRSAQSADNSTAARYAAIAFEVASLEESLEELDRRKIPHGPVTRYIEIEADGTKTKLYQNVILGKLLGSGFWLDTMILMGRLPGAGALAQPGKEARSSVGA